MPHPPITIVTRASPLAMAQARQIQQAVAALLPEKPDNIDTALPILALTTTGDQNLAASLAEIGGKGLFTKEIEHALLEGHADIAVHSMKDMPASMPEGLALGAIPARENPADSFLCATASHPLTLPKGAKVGTSSVRRAAQLLQLRPDLTIVPMRGNVGTRLAKLGDGEADATFLAEAGLRRLGMAELKRTILNPKEWLPALAQGALCLQIRTGDNAMRKLLANLACRDTSYTVSVERGFLSKLDGSCRTPIAGLATIKDQTIEFKAEVLSLDGAEHYAVEQIIPVASDNDLTTEMARLETIGAEVAEALLETYTPDLPKLLAQQAPR